MEPCVETSAERKKNGVPEVCDVSHQLQSAYRTLS